MSIVPILAAVAAALLLSRKGKAPSPACQAITSSGGDLDGVNYDEFVTAGADPNATLPMIVSLHGLGYDKTAHVKWLKDLDVPARVILPNGFYEKGSASERAWWPAYSNANLQEASERLSGFVGLIAQCRPTSGKPVMTGHSMGGFVALDFATQFPHLISASVPVAATRNNSLWDIEPGVPVHAVHGRLDNSFEAGGAYYEEMANRGLPVYFHPVDAGAHRLAAANAAVWRDVLSGLL